MTTLALAAPATFVSGPPSGGAIVGIILPAVEGTSMAANAGFSVPNNGSILVRVTVGAAGAGNLNFIVQKTIGGGSMATTTDFQQVLVNSTVYIFGPFPPSIFNDVNGLLQATMSVPTGNFVGAYNLPGSVAGS
jgi:hypothetical protein